VELREERYDDHLIVHVCSSRIDASKAPDFKQAIIKWIENGHTRLVLDFSLVDFIDSTGLGVLVTCLKRLGKRGNLSIVGTKGAVSRLFSLTHMDRVFSLYPSLDAALARQA
jgi:anti-sigma B factor antagonist